MAKLPTVAPFTLWLVLCGADVILGTTTPLSLCIITGAVVSQSQGKRLEIWTVMMKKAIL